MKKKNTEDKLRFLLEELRIAAEFGDKQSEDRLVKKILKINKKNLPFI